MKKIIRNFLKFGLSIGLLLILFFIIGPKEIYQNLTKINPFYIPILFLIWYITLLIGSINMGILISPLKKIYFLKLFKYYLLTWSTALVIPGRLGEFSLAFFLKKEQINIGKGFAIIILDKLITISLYFIILLFGISLFFEIEEAIKIIFSFMLIFVIILFFIFHNKGRNLIKRYILRKYSTNFEGFSKTLKEYFKSHKTRLLLNFIVTFIRLIATSYILYLIFILLNQEIKFIYVLIIYAILAIIALIPITSNGLGLKEISGVILFSSLGINSSVTATVFTINLIIVYLIALFNVLIIKQKIY